ncbi:MAG: ABC transporter substrate-binding protein [Chloroflexi bacterium]|nr:MAG: ABC transporter substrate-binding protein [Chloroflexota bacterium]
MFKKSFTFAFALLIIASMVLAACQPAQTTPTEAPVVEPTAVEQPTAEVVPTEVPTPEVVQTTRKGGWLDEIVFSVVASDSALTQIEAGAIDIYANGLSSKDLPAIKDAGVSYSTSSGLYYDILYNPAGPEFTDGRFNPFSNRKIREATNWLFDRDYINQEVYAGGGLAKFFAITTQFPDYADLADVARKLESYYAYNFDKAKEVITAEMEGMGATLVDGKWMYKDAPVTLIYIIRNDSDGTRIPIGEYTAAQFEALGFTVDRQMKKGSEASPIWIGSDPVEGQWHLYTAAWSATVLDRDQSNIFQEMYLDSSAQGIPAFLDNVSDPEFKELGDRLATADFATLQERHDMMARALELSLQDSLQVFLIDGKQFTPYANGMVATADLAAGIEGAQIYPYTLRWADQEGGTVRWATQDLFAEPWNPIAGSNWAFDQGAIRATQSGDIMYDPYTGLLWPLRIEKADVVVKEGLPVGKTLDWVNLEFAPEITVPADAWIDWDAANQVFVTVGEKNPEGLTALRKTTLYYPADMFETVKWHDGANLSLADFVFGMIMTFDRAKPESAIYDAQAEPQFLPFQENFRGFKIVSTEPLVIEYYSDTYSLDAELNIPLMFPTYTFGEGSWDTMAVANAAEAGGELAYSVDKALEKEIEQTSFIGGPSLEVLAKYLDQAIADKTIPYAPTMSAYLTADEAVARYEALKAWYGEHNNFMVGTGPYFVDQAFLTEKTLTLKHFEDYPDLADRWSNFGEPKLAVVELDGPGQVKIGEEATFDVFVTFKDAAYPAAEIKQVKFLLYNAQGEIVKVAEAVAVEDGQYSVVLDTATTAALEAGSNKLEVAIVPFTVSQPTFASVEFVTAP